MRPYPVDTAVNDFRECLSSSEYAIRMFFAKTSPARADVNAYRAGECRPEGSTSSRHS